MAKCKRCVITVNNDNIFVRWTVVTRRGPDALWGDQFRWSIGCVLWSHQLGWSISGALWSDQLGWSISGALWSDQLGWSISGALWSDGA